MKEWIKIQLYKWIWALSMSLVYNLFQLYMIMNYSSFIILSVVLYAILEMTLFFRLSLYIFEKGWVGLGLVKK